MTDLEALSGAVVDRPLSEPRADELKPVAPEPPDAPEDRVMSLVDHLSELRRRLAISVVAILIGSAVGYYFAPQIVRLLVQPTPEQRVYFTEVGGAFFLYLKIALILGFALALPVILYQFWAFVSPGLTSHERSVARPWLPLAMFFFLLGIGVAYFVMPYAIGFLISFQSPEVVYLPTAEKYFGFLTTLFLGFGLVMEFPIVVVLLSKLGILSLARLRASRRYVLLGIAIFAVVATPGGDPVSPIVMGAVMFGLYELTIFMLARSGRPGTDDG